MAWADIKAGVDAVKAKYDEVHQKLVEAVAKLAECAGKEHIDAAELEAVKKELSDLAHNMQDDIHSDGM